MAIFFPQQERFRIIYHILRMFHKLFWISLGGIFDVAIANTVVSLTYFSIL